MAEAGYPDGFDIKMITMEAFTSEARVILKMLGRISITGRLEVLPTPKFFRKVYVPLLDKAPEEQDWDLALILNQDLYGHTGATLLAIGLIDKSDFRFTEYDAAYEQMWTDMAKTKNRDLQAEKGRRLARYAYERARFLFVYSPVNLYAANKQVHFVPQKMQYLRLKETSVRDRHWSVR
jgi:hypothetical protein